MKKRSYQQLQALKQRSKHGWVKNVIAKSVNSLSNTLCSRSLYILLLLLLLLLKIFKEGWLFSCRCFSRGPPFKYILQLKRSKISIKNLITTATKVSEELYTIMKTNKQVIKVDC